MLSIQLDEKKLSCFRKTCWALPVRNSQPAEFHVFPSRQFHQALPVTFSAYFEGGNN
jgi:hypothetical protein